MYNNNLKKALEKLPDLYSTDGKRGDMPATYVFIPDGVATWVIWEYSKEEGMGFGLCDLGLGFPELGYVVAEELDELRGKFGLPVEVDSTVTSRFDGYKRARIDVPNYLKEKV